MELFQGEVVDGASVDVPVGNGGMLESTAYWKSQMWVVRMSHLDKTYIFAKMA